jgi:hypothetical protein
MIRQVEPDFIIKIGIKDGIVISIDWSELRFQNPLYDRKDISKMISKIQRYLLERVSEIERGLRDEDLS